MCGCAGCAAAGGCGVGLQVSCTNGFERTVNARAANPIVKALNAYSTRKNLGVTCAVV